MQLTVKFWLVLVLSILTIGCVGSDSGASDPDAPTSDTPIVLLPNVPLADYELLFIGNSHSSRNDLSKLVTTLINIGETQKTAHADVADNWLFLDQRLTDGTTQKTIAGRAWTHVILQAQKYSSSGRYHYPTDAAQEWIRRIKAKNALPIMFPEWPRRGNDEEALRVHQLHLSIAAKEPACVAPIGLAWDEFIVMYPTISLHAADGNHSNLNGALLSAFVFYQVITGKNAGALPHVASIKVSADKQQKMRDVASLIVAQHPPCFN